MDFQQNEEEEEDEEEVQPEQQEEVKQDIVQDGEPQLQLFATTPQLKRKSTVGGKQRLKKLKVFECYYD